MHSHAHALELDEARFDRELKAGVHRAAVHRQEISGWHSHVISTPTFFSPSSGLLVPTKEVSKPSRLAFVGKPSRLADSREGKAGRLTYLDRHANSI